MNYQEAKGWLTAGEREFLFQTARRSPAIIVNVGVEFGASLVCLQEGAPHTNFPIVAIDIDLSKLEAKPNPGTRLIESDSGQVAMQWREWVTALSLATTDLGVVFVDGDHGYGGAMRDAAFAEFVIPGGVIAFHDCYSWEEPLTPHKICPEVNQAVQEWFGRQPAGMWQELPVVDSIRVFGRI